MAVCLFMCVYGCSIVLKRMGGLLAKTLALKLNMAAYGSIGLHVAVYGSIQLHVAVYVRIWLYMVV